MMAIADLAPPSAISANQATVFAVDDDVAIRKSISILIRSVGLNVATYPSAAEFLDEYDSDRAGCLVSDVRMPGMSGLELQEELLTRKTGIPIIFISDPIEVPMVTRAMRRGAIDFLIKPFCDELLLERVHQAIKQDDRNRRRKRERDRINTQLAHLTTREREILDLFVQGGTSRKIGNVLGISPKTVDNHRTKVLEKMNVDNLAQLVGIMIRYIGCGHDARLI